MEEKIFAVMLYGCVKGICTERNKNKIIEEIANKEFHSDINEADEYTEFVEFKLNKLKF